MIHVEHILIAAALILGLAGGFLLARSRLRPKAHRPEAVHQILLPFTGTEISRRAVDAAMRLARAEGATLMPAYLAQVPKSLPLECAIPNEAAKAMGMLEAIEQRASAQGVAVDARIERGRSYRHALARLLEKESFDRVVVPAHANGGEGLSGDDLIWLLQKAPAEVLILRPAPGDEGRVQAVPAKPIRRAPASSSIAPREERLTAV
ncbi:MAG TPA: universal stress protein [Solirubrobacterales bacterium]|nr:universal stress protein [Solirubrobacterales bacterium]